MSYSTLARQVGDQSLIGRVNSAGQKEAWNNPEFSSTDYGLAVQQGLASPSAQLIWPVSLDTEAAYESALLNEHPDPGGDPSVITDGQILAAVQVHWPPIWPLPVVQQPPAP